MFYTLNHIEELLPEHVGGKAANLNHMIRSGFNVPYGFVAGTQWSHSKDFERGASFSDGDNFASYLHSYIRWLAQITKTEWCGSGSSYGNGPLVVSVRSGAPISMPGMMDTILNIGITKNNIKDFVTANNSTMTFGLDCYRRLIQMYGSTVKDIPLTEFTSIYDAALTFWGTLDEEAYNIVIDFYEKIYKKHTGETFPDDPSEQLLQACNAVFKSWFSEKAKSYREIEGIDEKMGTAVTVQKMVFGNLNDQSATGVVFTHDPNTGIKGWYGDYLKSAQGEDVVAGTHKVIPIRNILSDQSVSSAGIKLQQVIGKLYQMNRDILDIEFTIENGELYILQYRVAKRSRGASVRNIIDMTRDGEISSEEATKRFLNMLPETESGDKDPGDLILLGKGLGATEGVVVAKIAIGHKQADKFHKNGEKYVYVAKETAPDDVTQMKNAAGILTALGGSVSHAVVVARAWNKTCVVGFSKIMIEDDHFTCGGNVFKNGDLIKINGSSGEVWA